MMLSAWMVWSNFQSMESLLMEYAIRSIKKAIFVLESEVEIRFET